MAVYIIGLGPLPSSSGTATAIIETGGPTTLTIGAIADGQFLKRVGTTVVGSAAGTGDLLAANNLSDVVSITTSRTNLIAAKSGANSDITSLAGLLTPLSVAQGGTGSATAGGALTNFGVSAYIQTLLDDVDAPTARGTLGLVAIAASGSATDLSAGTVPAARMPAHTGDVTSSAGSVALTIAAGAVTLAKQANLAANSIQGNNTGSAATPIALTVAQTKTLLAIAAGDVSGLATIATSGSASDLGSGTVAAARMPALTGDISTSAGAVATALATVNSNVGSFTYASITVNGKGLVTAASSGAAPEVPLTFSNGVTRTTNTVKNDLTTGVAGGQTATGGTAASEILTLRGTSHATKGSVRVGTGFTFDEATIRAGINNLLPSYQLDVTGYMASSGYFLGTDYCILPVAGGQSACSTYWGMQLRGNWQGGYAVAPANIGANDSLHVIVAGAQAGKPILVVQGATSQTANLQDWRNASLSVLSSVDASGNLLLGVAGVGYKIKEGSNARMGSSVLVGGTVTVSNTSVTATTRIFLTNNANGGTVGTLYVSARTASTSFVITSSSALDTSTVSWMLVEPA